MKKRLSYTACKDGHCVVMCGKTALGCIEPKGQIFKKRVVFQEDVLDGAEWTGECLIELGEHMLSLENKVSRKPAHTGSTFADAHAAYVRWLDNSQDEATLIDAFVAGYEAARRTA